MGGVNRLQSDVDEGYKTSERRTAFSQAADSFVKSVRNDIRVNLRRVHKSNVLVNLFNDSRSIIVVRHVLPEEKCMG
jgi:hypothetical protein